MSSILCFGDSNTFGYRPGGAGRYEPSVRYPGVLSRMLGSRYTVCENGVIGRTTVFEDPRRPGRCGLTQITQAVQEFSPAVLLLMLGTNDCKTQFAASPEQIAAGMLALADAARQTSPVTEILLVSPAVLSDEALTCGDYNEHSLAVSRQLHRTYRLAAAAHGCGFWDAGQSAQVSPVDGEHLTACGHAALARDLLSVLAQRLSAWEVSA